ncbi:hypothetical protein AMECASPLE_025349 [Ameca splendens]|uniref:Uncharacterized protein n=1 Tax=Ameca splendens TaxID=208324 RepID=A0ABV0YSB8_9TELE
MVGSSFLRPTRKSKTKTNQAWDHDCFWANVESKFNKMDSKTFYSARLHVPLALVPANPHDSDADMSDDDDPILDPDYQPTQAEYSSDTSF